MKLTGIFRVCSAKSCIVGLVSRLHGPLHQVPGMEKAHSHGPEEIFEFWCYGVMTYHFGNLLTSQTLILSQIFYFSPKMQNLLGVQNAGNEGAAKILDFDLFS